MASHSLLVAARNFSVPPGVTYECFGPWRVPLDFGTLHSFQPEVDMAAVHHMILYGSATNQSRCGGTTGQILYAWARTGQTTPIGFDLMNEASGLGLGFEIGPRYVTFVTLQIHYQRREDADVLHGDCSGIRLGMRTVPPRTPLRVSLSQLVPSIPARSVVDQCIRCSVIRSGTVYAFRNHAHRLGREVWSDHLRHHNQTVMYHFPAVGLMDA